MPLYGSDFGYGVSYLPFNKCITNFVNFFTFISHVARIPIFCNLVCAIKLGNNLFSEETSTTPIPCPSSFEAPLNSITIVQDLRLSFSSINGHDGFIWLIISKHKRYHILRPNGIMMNVKSPLARSGIICKTLVNWSLQPTLIPS